MSNRWRNYGTCQVCREDILVPDDQGADGYVHTAEDGEDIHAECCESTGPCARPTAFSFVESLRLTNTNIDWSN